MKKVLTLLFVAALTYAPHAGAQVQTITTIAGGGTDDVTNGVDAHSVRLLDPWAIAVDDNCNVYFTEPGRCVVRKVTPTGDISTVAGTENVVGNAGNGGPATAATLNMPYGIAVDHAGNLFIADTKNNAIRRVGTNGIITTYRAGISEPMDVAINAAGDLFIATSAGNAVLRIAAGNGPMTTLASGFDTYIPHGPYGYTGDLWWYNNCRLNGIAVDAADNVYIADHWQNYVRKITPAGYMNGYVGHMTEIGAGDYKGDGGPAASAYFNGIRRVAIDPAGRMTICDQGNCRIRRMDETGKVISIAGGKYVASGDGGPAIDAGFASPLGVAYDKNGYLYITDNGAKTIRRISPGTVAVAETMTHTNQLTLSPNPSHGSLRLGGTMADMETKEAALELMDMTGAVVYKTTVAANKGNIDAPLTLSNTITNGTYLLRVSGENSSTTLPFVVAR